MVVTNIEELAKSRSKIYIDGEFAFVLYKGELRLYGMKVGAQLSQNDYQTIMNEVLPKRAKLRSMNLLKSKDYTKEQLRRKLREGFYPEAIIDEAIEYVKSYHYIDDYRYCIQFIEYNAVAKSRQRMIRDLGTKGVDREVILKAMDELSENTSLYSEDALIKDLIKKKNFDIQTTDNKEKQRIMRYLYGKGFSMESINKAIGMSYSD